MSLGLTSDAQLESILCGTHQCVAAMVMQVCYDWFVYICAMSSVVLTIVIS